MIHLRLPGETLQLSTSLVVVVPSPNISRALNLFPLDFSPNRLKTQSHQVILRGSEHKNNLTEFKAVNVKA